MGHLGRQYHNGKNNGDRPTQADPGHKSLVLLGHFGKGEQAKGDAQGPGHKDHYKADDQSGYDDRNQFAGIDEQSQGKEHEQLAHPGHPVKEVQGGPFVDKTGISDDQSPDIDSQKPISLQEIGDGEYKDAEGKDQNGI